MTEGSELVNGWTIYYEKFGNGPNIMLLMSGALGTAQTDWYEQLEGEDPFDLEKFTIIAPQSPGWGKSKPPDRPYGADLYQNDVECFYQLMKKLGHERFYVVGWSDGGIVGLAMSAKYPKAIKRMAFHGALVYLFPQTLSVLKKTENVENWGKERLDRLMKVYGTKQEVQRLWSRHLKFCDYFNSYYPMDNRPEKYNDIKFPLLIMHGDKDPISHIEHPEHILKRLPHAKFHRFPNGNHDLHTKYTASYKKLVESFLLD